MVRSGPSRPQSPLQRRSRSRSRSLSGSGRRHERSRSRSGRPERVRSRSRSGRRHKRTRSGRRERSRSRQGFRRRERSRSRQGRSRSPPPQRHRPRHLRAEGAWSPLPLTYHESFEERVDIKEEHSTMLCVYNQSFEEQVDIEEEHSTMLCVYNLGDQVTSDDIRRFFAHIGPMATCTLKCNRLGQSMGIAELVYSYPGDAIRAIRMYRGITLDGRPMRFELFDI